MVEFKVACEEYNEENIPFHGNKFLNGNGYFGIRGTLEEYTKEHMPAVNMAGIYDRVGDAWRESVNAPNPLFTYITVNGKKYSLPENAPFSHIQELDFRKGVHTRKTIWDTEYGKVTVMAERFASMADQHAVGMKYSVCAEKDVEITVYTGIDADVWDINGPHFASVNLSDNGESICALGITGEKGIAVKTEEKIDVDFDADIDTMQSEKRILHKIRLNAEGGKEYVIEKCAKITSSVDENESKQDIKELSYAELKAGSISAWEKIWDISAIEIEGDDEAELALNYSVYHLNCIAPRNMKGKSIPARGLSGQVYKGAVFWDTEMFMIDYYIHTEPQIAKTLLQYRIDTIGGARAKAEEYGLNGAYYAWESQEGGYEGCSDYNVTDVFTKRPVRTYFRDKQYHVSAAIVYGLMKYIRGTGDYSILADGAMEMVVECARMYRSLLIKYADKPYYEIHDVVGPDEYHERVNNNAYTNRMAKFVFDTALDLLSVYQREFCGDYSVLDKKYGLEEIKEMLKDSSDNIFIPKPNKQGVIEQFDGYFKREDVSVDEVRSRLLDPREYWGGADGVAAHTQVLKQADVAAMLSMFRNDYDTDIMKINFDYYEPRTEHGSSLSACMYSLLACYTGNSEIAYPLFMKSASADLMPGGKEWIGLIYIGGTHPASEGGAWIVAVKGFAGLDIVDGRPVCAPCLPEKWKGMKFKINVRDVIYSVTIKGNTAKITEENRL